MKTLGAVMFVHNGDEFDYNYRETIACMKAFADQVVILDAGSTDGTAAECLKYEDYMTKVILKTEDEWRVQTGREKLAYFQNEAKKALDTDYYMCIQADEILHESSFGFVREAISLELPAFMCTRFNLWLDAYHYLDVPQDRKPCSTEVIRLALTEFNSVNDGESFDCPQVCFDYLDKIRIYHMGFVRKPDVMKKKVISIQEDVFLTPHDARLDESNVFDHFRYFEKSDVKPIIDPLPKFVQAWAQERWPEDRRLKEGPR